MTTRRQFIQTGLGAVMLGLTHGRALGRPPGPLPRGPVIDPYAAPRPVAFVPPHPKSITVGGFPFAQGFTGDDFADGVIPFHTQEDGFPGGEPPAPTERVDVAVVGGGLSGLTAAYLLRDHLPVVFELRKRFGGVSMGEVWEDTEYSFGGAYFIAPDKGDFLESFYADLGLDKVYTLSAGHDPVESGGVLLPEFWSGVGVPEDQVKAFGQYAEIVKYYTKNYPDIPLPKDKDNQWILDLDKITLKQDIEAKMGPVPPLLAAGIQAYCYSSFDAGWEELSAAAGWNFIAAEEFGRWICPGGNSYVVDVLWQRLRDHYAASGVGGASRRLRAGTRVVQVRRWPGSKDGLIQVVYKDPVGATRSLLARRVVMANSKHICKYMLPELHELDPLKETAMQRVLSRAYVVANVLIDRPTDYSFYDMFLLGREFPVGEIEAQQAFRLVDVVNGHFAEKPGHPQSVLTLYWPLPWNSAMFTAIVESAFQTFSERLAQTLPPVLKLLKLPNDSVRQIRLSRWGHSMPMSLSFFIADGNPEHLRRPLADHIYFANQDNWALPAFETSVLEGKHVADLIEKSFK